MHPALRLIPLLVLLAGCHDEGPDAHVFASPPPRPVQPPAVAQPAEPTLPLGTKGPGAEIRSVLDAATGTPVSLTSASGTVDVLALVALGPGDWSASRVHADLAIRGTHDTTVALRLGTPPPSMVAHAFRVSLDALGPGRYSMRARVLGDGTRVLVESTPVFLVVPGR